MNRILTYPQDAALLRRKAKRVKNPQETKVILAVQAMKRLADEWEQQNPGRVCAGLAATQINVPLRIVIVRNQSDNPKSDKWLVMYNPVFKDSYGLQDSEEGCLSLPGISWMTLRPERSAFHFYDQNLKRFPEVGEYEAVGESSAVICHELDHLNGVLGIDSAFKIWRTGTKPTDPCRMVGEDGTTEIDDEGCVRCLNHLGKFIPQEGDELPVCENFRPAEIDKHELLKGDAEAE